MTPDTPSAGVTLGAAGLKGPRGQGQHHQDAVKDGNVGVDEREENDARRRHGDVSMAFRVRARGAHA